MAQMGPPDMRGAIGFALNYPKRINLAVERIDFAKLANLSFESVDLERFPALRLAREVSAAGGLHGAAFNAAKETALDGFLSGQIGFMQMAILVEQALENSAKELASCPEQYTLDDVIAVDDSVRRRSAQIAAEMAIEA